MEPEFVTAQSIPPQLALALCFFQAKTQLPCAVAQPGSSQSPVPSSCARVPGEREEAKEEGSTAEL